MALQADLPTQPSYLRTIECSGTPYEIGHTHGTQAADLVTGSIAFYATLFHKNSGKSWPEVKQLAATFHDAIQRKWPRYADELRGVATGAGVSILDVVALNVRTEIAYGLRTTPPSDGCTSGYYRPAPAAGATGAESALQGQNWDWMVAQRPNLVYLSIKHGGVEGLPDIKMITEAGIIGKIGINSHGVGVCFNALAVPGVDYDGLPAHLALRVALEAKSAAAARQDLEKASGGGQMAACAFVLVGDAREAVGCEFASTNGGEKGDVNGCVWQGVEELEGGAAMLVHANHCLLDHPQSAKDQVLLKDSPARVGRLRELIKEQHANGPVSKAAFTKFFEDGQGFPSGIDRKEEGVSYAETLFNIVIAHEKGGSRARVKIGRPSEGGEEFELRF